MATVSLKVAEAFQNDIGRGIARIDSKAKSELGVSTGDIIKLVGKKAALAIVWQAQQDDEGLDMIRMDGILRQNVGVGLGEKVRAEPVQTKVAKKIVLAPQEAVRYSVGFDQYVKKRLVGKPVLKGNLLPVGIFGTSIPLIVAQVFPQGPVMITEETDIRIQKEPAKEMAAVPNITYDDVGGLKDAIQKVREMIELPLRHPEIFERLGIDPPKGVLLYGAPGTGKTLLAKAVANESDANFFYVGGPEIISKYVGESEERLRKLFAEAQENSPSIIFIDEIDAIAPKREEVVGEVEKRMVSQMLCVSPTTRIHTPAGPITIEEFYNKNSVSPITMDGIELSYPEEAFVHVLDKENRINTGKVTAMTKLFVPDTRTAILDNGCRLTVSAIQRFLTFRNNRFEWIPITELTEGDCVAAPSALPSHANNWLELGALERLDESRYTLKISGNLKMIFGGNYVSLKRLKEFMRTGTVGGDGTARTELVRRLRTRRKITAKELFANESKNRRILLRRLLRELQRNGTIAIHREGAEYRDVEYTAPGNFDASDIEGISVFRYFNRFIKDSYFVELPRRFSPDLAELLGYILADGSLSRTRMNVSGKPEIVERAARITWEIFGFEGTVTKIHDAYWRFDAGSETLPALLSEIFGFKTGKKAYTVRAPAQLFQSPSACISAFVRAYCDCDGSVERSIRIFSRSKGMMDDLACLLLMLGFQTSYSFSNGMHYCNVLGGTRAIEAYRQLVGSVRKDRFDAVPKGSRGSSVDTLPDILTAINTMKSGFDGKLDDNDYRYLNGARPIGRDKLGYFLCLYGDEGIQEQQVAEESLRQLLSAEVSWKRIVSIQESEPMIMYDLVTETENFIAGDIPTLLHNTTMDGLKARGEVIVIGATNRPDSIDPALRRPGRFDREIEIGVPDKQDRREILNIQVRNMPLAEDVNVAEIANVTHGYTGADLSLLSKEAALKALRRVLPTMNVGEEALPQEMLERIRVCREDFFNGMHEIQPSALREVYVERPTVKWSDIGGMEEVKRELQEAVELPLKKPEIFDRMGIRTIKGILLYGPPGTGKTLLAKAVANETEANFISISGAQVLTKYVGESEKAVRELFRKARSAAPCVLFIDEIDALAPHRSGSGEAGTLVTERVVDTLLTEMDGLRSLKNVVVIAATNRPDIVDPALMRPGRFDRLIEVIAPDEKARLQVFRICTARMPMDKDVNLRDLARLTEGYTGADIDNLVREAGMMAIREDTKKVSIRHFELSFKMIVPSIKKEHVESVQKFKAAAVTMYR